MLVLVGAVSSLIIFLAVCLPWQISINITEWHKPRAPTHRDWFWKIAYGLMNTELAFFGRVARLLTVPHPMRTCTIQPSFIASKHMEELAPLLAVNKTITIGLAAVNPWTDSKPYSQFLIELSFVREVFLTMHLSLHALMEDVERELRRKNQWSPSWNKYFINQHLVTALATPVVFSRDAAPLVGIGIHVDYFHYFRTHVQQRDLMCLDAYFRNSAVFASTALRDHLEAEAKTVSILQPLEMLQALGVQEGQELFIMRCLALHSILHNLLDHYYHYFQTVLKRWEEVNYEMNDMEAAFMKLLGTEIQIPALFGFENRYNLNNTALEPWDVSNVCLTIDK